VGFSTIVATAFGVLITAAVLVALVRSLVTRRAPPPHMPRDPGCFAAAAGVEEVLSALIRRATVSLYDHSAEDGAAFNALKADLLRLFPRFHAVARREELGDRALLYEWRGYDESYAPVILCAHFDVVPAEDASSWKHPPFSGDIAEGAVWGRGSQDIKCTLAALLHAAERLISDGFRPKRTVYLAFGGDEETGGVRGAKRIGEVLASRGVRASFLLDEGGPIADGLLSFADRPLALVGISEKGYMDVLVETSGAERAAMLRCLRAGPLSAIWRAPSRLSKARP
jgi:carboxypeptidase PM20D1